MKITKSEITGAVCLLVFIVFGMSSLIGGIPQLILFFFLGIIIEVASFYIMSLAMLKDTEGESWLVLIPFTILLIFSRLILNWDLLIPFYIMGILSVVSCYIFKYDKTGEKNTDNNLVIKVVLSGFAAIFLFISITGFVGVYI